MENHGTPSSCTNGQFATISGRLTIALPRALQLSGLDVKSVLRHTDEGERLSLALAEALKMLYNGNAATVVTSHIIDCDADPYVPDDWKVEEHKRGGKFKFYPSLMQLFLTEDQQDSMWVEPRELRKELAGKPVLNANVLKFLLAHTELIPEEWKGKTVFFWGTIYRKSEPQEEFPPHSYVCSLDWRDDEWHGGFEWIGGLWPGVSTPAALRIV